MTNKPLPTFVYKLLILVATLIWGASFVFMKGAVETVEPSWLVGIRFLLAAFVLGALFFKRFISNINKKTIVAGAAIGTATFAAYWFQTVGLVYTTPGKNAFLTAIYCVLVPFVAWVATRKRPGLHNVVAGVVCIIGVGFVSLTDEGLTLGLGDALTIVCGLFFAIQIVVISIFGKDVELMSMTVWMFIFTGGWGIIVGALTEVPPVVSALMNADFLLPLAYLVLLGSCVSMLIQNVACANVPASQAAILLATESVFGVMFSVIMYGETLNAQLLIGFVLIFASIVISEAIPDKKQASAPAAATATAASDDVLEALSDADERIA
jgi:drug/metabolite transporter (DMT)-like permease